MKIDAGVLETQLPEISVFVSIEGFTDIIIKYINTRQFHHSFRSVCQTNVQKSLPRNVVDLKNFTAEFYHLKVAFFALFHIFERKEPRMGR